MCACVKVLRASLLLRIFFALPGCLGRIRAEGVELELRGRIRANPSDPSKAPLDIFIIVDIPPSLNSDPVSLFRTLPLRDASRVSVRVRGYK